MRLNRPLSKADQWDIVFLFGVLVIAFISLATLWPKDRSHQMPAFAVNSPASINSVENLPVNSVDPQDPIAKALGPASKATAPATPTVAPIVEKPIRAVPEPEYKWYNGQKYRYLKTMRMRVTAYSADGRCCWPYPGTTTASGLSVKTNHGRLVAADTNILPFHSLVSVPGYHNGQAVPVLDRGGAIKGRRVDVLLPSFAQAQNWGMQTLSVKVYVPVDN